MALMIDTLRDRRSSKSRFVSTRRLLITKDDQVVEDGDPAGVRLLVAAGASIPIELAEQYGLLEATAPDVKRGHPAQREAEAERQAALEAAFERGRLAGREELEAELAEAAKASAEKSAAPAEDKAQKPQEDKAAKPAEDKAAGKAKK